MEDILPLGAVDGTDSVNIVGEADGMSGCGADGPIDGSFDGR